jgi:hypothetical protein
MLYKNIDGVDTPMTAEEEAEHLASLRPRIEVVTEKVRLLRNNLLANTDWTQVNDAPVDKVVWATYRQALRDVPSQSGFPNQVVWPTKPE